MAMATSVAVLRMDVDKLAAGVRAAQVVAAEIAELAAKTTALALQLESDARIAGERVKDAMKRLKEINR